MKSFRSDIIKQIDTIPEGKIFTFIDLDYPIEKSANVAVILSGLAKGEKLVRVEKGAYYRPKQSSLGLGILPIYQNEQLSYLTRKLDGYLTGTYIYNKMSLTDQVPSVITIAVPQPVRSFKFKKLSVECVKSYVDKFGDENTLYLLRLLDAIKDLKYIPGTTPLQAYNKIFTLHISRLSAINLKKIVSLATNYPPRVRKILSDMLKKNNRFDLSKQLVNTICPTTRFELPYETI
ncbi:hypothetical protein SAMN05216357_10615 [Porphyromonadaceae bacterium KH3CP3RA]|nr:hypothetical protein SAMN05216357_10615 [Porphyromonadaceae bacterium KH3CP3RA]